MKYLANCTACGFNKEKENENAAYRSAGFHEGSSGPRHNVDVVEVEEE